MSAEQRNRTLSRGAADRGMRREQRMQWSERSLPPSACSPPSSCIDQLFVHACTHVRCRANRMELHTYIQQPEEWSTANTTRAPASNKERQSSAEATALTPLTRKSARCSRIVCFIPPHLVRICLVDACDSLLFLRLALLSRSWLRTPTIETQQPTTQPTQQQQHTYPQ